MPPENLLPPPLRERRGIPFYHDKTEAEFRRDVYERYDELVMRQTALHLCDELHGGYPLAEVIDYIRANLPTGGPLRIAELGCGVGRMSATLASAGHQLYGLDFSYQMLRQATDFWLLDRPLQLNATRYGWGTRTLRRVAVPPNNLARTQVQGGGDKPRPIQGQRWEETPNIPSSSSVFENLRFALANAAALPFPDASLDVIFSSFLLDRLPQPRRALAEWRRVLRPGGRLIVVTPLNFLAPAAWREFHPPVRLLNLLRHSGWQVLDWTDPVEVFEPMDARGNGMRWRCLAFSCEAEVKAEAEAEGGLAGNAPAQP